jgi:hypothetical protein
MATPQPTAPGLWGVVLATHEVADLASRFPRSAACDLEHQRVHDSLGAHGLTFAGNYLGVNIYLRPQRGPAGLDLSRHPVSPSPYPYLFVWVVRPENLLKHADWFTTVLGADFETVAIPGGNVAMSWDAGIELVAPETDDRQRSDVDVFGNAATQPHFDYLCARGESPWSVVLRVADVEEFRERAVRLGFDPSELLQESDPILRREWYRSWTHKAIEQRETRLSEFLGLRLMAGEVTYADSTEP